MKILYVLDFFHPHVGGVPTMFKNLAENMSKLGHDVTVVTSHANGTRRFEMHGKVKVHRFGRSREQFMVGATMFLLRSKEKFDVVHTSTYSAMIPSYTFSVFKKTPEVLSVHEVWSLDEWLEFTGAKGLFYYIEERMLFAMPFDTYISPSRHTKKDLEMVGVRPSKVRVIPHGIDGRIFHPRAKRSRSRVRRRYKISKDDVVGCFVGKATRFKGIEYLLDSLEVVLIGKKRKFIFVLSKLHKKGYEKFLKRVSKSRTLREKVILIQPSSDPETISRIVAACDFLVMPSLTEGFGLAVAEAASMGIPVIATRRTSMEEVLDKRNAVFVEPRSRHDLIRAISRMMSDRRFLKRMSKRKKFWGWDNVAREYVKVYQDVIRKHKEAGGRCRDLKSCY